MIVNLGSDNALFMGWDRMTDDEIIWFMDHSPNPELMGGKLKKWFKKAGTRAKKIVSKVKKKVSGMPKWAKIATGVLAAPLAPTLTTAALTTAGTAAAVAIPTATAAAGAKLTASAAKGLAKKVREKRVAKQQARIAAQEAAAQEEALAQQGYTTDEYGNVIPVATTSTTAQSQGGGILPWALGAAALIPFLI